jgi:hypothetical protein
MKHLAKIILSVNFSAEVVAVLKKLAKKRCTTMTEILRQAIGTEKFFDDVSDEGGKILVEDKRGRLRQLVF